MKKHLFVLLAASACLTGIAAQAQPAEIAAIVKNCESCHGPRGDSPSATVPRLNGQPAEYLQVRFASFADPTRQTPHASANMWPVSGQVADKIIPDLAKYFAAQPATPAKPNGLHIAEGKRLYEKGNPEMPACQSCHGASGEGKGPNPRLAGQHADYLTAQLRAYYYQVRVSGRMHPSIKFIAPEQIDAIAAYLANG